MLKCSGNQSYQGETQGCQGKWTASSFITSQSLSRLSPGTEILLPSLGAHARWDFITVYVKCSLCCLACRSPFLLPLEQQQMFLFMVSSLCHQCFCLYLVKHQNLENKSCLLRVLIIRALLHAENRKAYRCLLQSEVNSFQANWCTFKHMFTS